MTWYLIAIVILLDLSPFLNFRMGQDQKYKYVNWKAIHDLLFVGNSHFYQDIHSLKCALSWPRPLESVKVKCKYANQKPMYDLVFDGSYNFYVISHHFQDKNVKMCLIMILPFESPYMTCYLMAVVIFTLSFLVNRIFNLNIEGQGHEKQRSALYHYMA